jgi:hypothetical protein
MKMSFLAPTMIFAIAAFTQACAANANDDGNGVDADEQEIQGAVSLKAATTTVALKKTVGKCTVDSSFLQVKTASSAVDAVINKVLARTFEEMVFDTDCRTEGLDRSGGMTVVYNSRGILSVVDANDYMSEGAAHPSVVMRTYNFDLRTGKQLQLTNILNADGRKKLSVACTKIYEPEGLDSSFCGINADAQFSVEAKGIRFLQPEVPHVIFALGAEGQMLPWKDLKGTVTSALVKGVAR